MIYPLNSPEISKLTAGQFAIPKLRRESTLQKLLTAQGTCAYIPNEVFEIARTHSLASKNIKAYAANYYENCDNRYTK